MSVPKFFEFFESILHSLADGNLHNSSDIQEFVSKDMNLTTSDMAELLPSSRQATWINRTGWARTYLSKAGLVESPSRGKFQITEEGLKALNTGQQIDLKYLYQYESFRTFHKRNINKKTEKTNDATIEETSPKEALENAINNLNSTLASDLLDEVMKLSPSQFEKLVVHLLISMGYGSGIDDAGIVTPQSNDGGIDGIIKEDQLGFSSIYIQAKQWSIDRTVDKPEIQKFVGALTGLQAQKGLFITTAKFSNGASQYADNLLNTKVVLVDGKALTKLMIKHNVGVSIERTYELKRIDSDYFLEEL